MELTSIIIVIVAFITGCLLTFIINKFVNKNSLSDRIAKLEAENQDVINRLSNERAEYSQKRAEFSKKIEDSKKEYESLLEAANAECKRLDEDLKNALTGNVDDVLRERLEEVDALKKKVKVLEEEIEDNEDDIDDLKKKLRSKDDNISELQISL